MRMRRRGTTEEPPRRGASAEFLAAVRPTAKAVITCGHPDRQHGGKGLCHPCYMTQWIKEHPDANSGPGWLKNNPERARYYKVKNNLKKHGITPERYEEMWTEQEGRCANPRCDAWFEMRAPDYRRALHVDHDHETGQIRALLCPSCNVALGQARDDIERLLGLAEYLSRHQRGG